jgi:thiamine pyrophosphokinase
MPAEGFMHDEDQLPVPLAAVPSEIDHGFVDLSFVIVIGAEPLDPAVVALLPTQAQILAADSGTDHALAAGLTPHAVIGDLDSISPAGLAWARSQAEVIEHSPLKDHTDTELALQYAAQHHPGRIILLSGGGDRLDHTMAAFGALGSPELTAVPHLECWWGGQYALVLHGPSRIRIAATAGEVISLLALHGPCTGVTITGTQWELSDSALNTLSGHGVSNVAVAPRVQIAVSSGVLTVFFTSPPNLLGGLS